MEPELKSKMLKVNSCLNQNIDLQTVICFYFKSDNNRFFHWIGNPVTSMVSSDSIKSVCIKQTIVGMDCTYAVACKGNDDNLSYCTQFDPNGNGQKLWNDLASNGKLTESIFDEKLKGENFNLLLF